ncbi:N-acetyltransferase [Nitrosomonas sp. JL21]|nr:GNAT family N-acetyltransferase [Nitrosomonas sp.]MXS78581.1 N-acetyltransferase [Nitrosomonas sp. JL21]
MSSSEAPPQWNTHQWLCAIDEQFRKQDYRQARNLILQALPIFPDHAMLRDRLLMVDSHWSEPIASRGIHLVTPDEHDFSYLQQCYADEAFMQQFLPMGRKKQSAEAIQNALRQSEFSVAHHRSMHRIIKKEVPSIPERSFSPGDLKPIGLASLVDIQIAHRRAEFLVGIPDQAERQRATAVVMMLIMDLAFNQVRLHKLTSLVLANNPHSQRSTVAIGFTQEGLRRQHLCDPQTRQWLDCYENGLVADDFRHNPVIARVSKRLLGRDITVKPI